jgi:hypothetical protein
VLGLGLGLAIARWYAADLDELFECRYAVMQMECRIRALLSSAVASCAVSKYSFA